MLHTPSHEACYMEALITDLYDLLLIVKPLFSGSPPPPTQVTPTGQNHGAVKMKTFWVRWDSDDKWTMAQYTGSPGPKGWVIGNEGPIVFEEPFEVGLEVDFEALDIFIRASPKSYIVQGLYEDVWKDWLGQTMTLERARTAKINFDALRGKTSFKGAPTDSRIIRRIVKDEIVV